MMKVTCSVRALQVIALMRVEECLVPTGGLKELIAFCEKRVRGSY
jgi:hypothetical protein